MFRAAGADMRPANTREQVGNNRRGSRRRSNTDGALAAWRRRADGHAHAVMDGLAVTRELRRTQTLSALPIVAKPFDPAELRRVLFKWIGTPGRPERGEVPVPPGNRH